ncbi:MAG: GMC family oxidoreductase [Deltaproteobacteria bacterium]|nr:GMC family oxidoreductase [Deltaproteobacteria bacterium]
MIVDWTALSSDRDETADVCVVGSGCGGATIAHVLAEAGKKVIILERGGAYAAADFDQREEDMLAKVDGGRGLDASHDLSVQLTYGNNVGGASVHYWADSYRTPIDRLELWQEKFGIQGHDHDALEPHFARIEKDLNVHVAAPEYWNPMNRLVQQGAKALGWTGHGVPQARKGCQKSGYCMQGCAYDAKQSQLVTYIPRALAAGARLFADTEAWRFERAGAKIVSLTARVIDRARNKPKGPVVRVRAKAFVLAAGGYGTPTVLLRNGFQRELPAVGQYTICNPCPMVHAVFDREIVQFRNIPAAFAVEHFRLARMEGGKYVEGGYLLMANQLQPATLAAVLPGVGASHRALMRDLRRLGGTISWIDDADYGSISLDGDRPRFRVPIDGQNGLRIRDAMKKQARLLLTVGAKEVLFGDLRDTRITRLDQIDGAVGSLDLGPGRVVLAAPHPAGGARMGSDRKTSVVGFDHRVHGTDNLFVADPSVFPNGPSVDPSVTIMAFSYVAAEHVAKVV